MYGKAIELFLVNGSADSLTTAELSNWNGKAIKIPRTEISGCERSDIKGIGAISLCVKRMTVQIRYILEKQKMY